MLRSTMLGTAVAVAGLVAAPAGALAAGTLIAGPVKHKGYQVSISASDAPSRDTLTVTAAKSSGKSQQLHSWSFDGVKVSIKGSRATIKGSLGSFGRIDTSLNATRKSKLRRPKGCTGSAGSVRSGALKGTTRLTLDRTFFRTWAPKRLPAQIITSGNLRCDGTIGSGGGGGTDTPESLTLTGSAQTAAGSLLLSIVRNGDAVSQTFMRTDTKPAGSKATVSHIITAQTGAAGLQAAADLSTATGRAQGPYLTGTLDFAGESLGTMATGTISGSFAARFDSIGTQSLPAGNDAMLIKR